MSTIFGGSAVAVVFGILGAVASGSSGTDFTGIAAVILAIGGFVTAVGGIFTAWWKMFLENQQANRAASASRQTVKIDMDDLKETLAGMQHAIDAVVSRQETAASAQPTPAPIILPTPRTGYGAERRSS